MPANIRRRIKRPLAATAFGCVWLAAVVVGFTSLVNHSLIAGNQGSFPSMWPSTTRVHREADHPCLLMFAHSECPCTRASLGELEKIIARNVESMSATVVYFEPTVAGRANSSRSTICSIAGAQTFVDDGSESRRFNVTTSGQTLLYGRDGRLLFSGGITAARGHAGDSEGGQAIETLLRGETPAVRQTPVYGCSIAQQPSRP